MSLSRLTTEGWRPRAGAEHTLLHSTLSLDASPRDTLRLALALVDAPRAEDPGGLTLAEREGEARQAAPTSLRFATGEALRQGRVGLAWERTLGEEEVLEARAFYAARSFRNALPFTVVSFDRGFWGASARYTRALPLLGLPGRFSAGLEAQVQADRRLNLDNQDGRPGTTLSLHQDERVEGAALFLQEELTLTEGLTLVAGGRLDGTRYGVDDLLVEDGDGSGERTFLQPTGRLGLVYSPSHALSLWASFSQAFEAPTTTELADLEQGGLNASLRPQRADSLEVGVRARPWRRLSLDVALFGVRVADGLVRQEDARGRAFFRNAGLSRHLGLEAGLTARLPLFLHLRAAYTLLDATYLSYAPGGVSYAGHTLPGLPLHHLGGELTFRPPGGLLLGLQATSAGGRFVDDANSYQEPYALVLGARAAWEVALGRWALSPFLGAHNLTSAAYNDSVRINAAGGRHFEPAPPFSLWGGLGLAWRPEAGAPQGG